MINVTRYCKEKGIYNADIIKSFKKLQRVKPFLTSSNIITKRGRYDGCVLMSEELFGLFKMWLNRIPLPLINRQEYDVLLILKAVYPDLLHQYKLKNYVYDFFVPSKKLLIEYDETHHKQSTKAIEKTNKKMNYALENKYNYHCISQNKMAEEISNMITLYHPHQK